MHVCEVEGRVVLISAHQGEGNAMEPAKPSCVSSSEGEEGSTGWHVYECQVYNTRKLTSRVTQLGVCWR